MDRVLPYVSSPATTALLAGGDRLVGVRVGSVRLRRGKVLVRYGSSSTRLSRSERVPAIRCSIGNVAAGESRGGFGARTDISTSKSKVADLKDILSERGACGVGFIANLKNEASHKIVQDALTALGCMEHRGGCGADSDSGDGAGLMTSIPWSLYNSWADENGIAPLDKNKTGVGMVFLPKNETHMKEAKAGKFYGTCLSCSVLITICIQFDNAKKTADFEKSAVSSASQHISVIISANVELITHPLETWIATQPGREEYRIPAISFSAKRNCWSVSIH